MVGFKNKNTQDVELDIFEDVEISLSNGFSASIPKVVEIFKDISVIVQGKENKEITDKQFIELVCSSFSKNTTKTD